MLHIFNLLIFPFIADVVIQIAALYSSNNTSAHPVAYPKPPRIQFARPCCISSTFSSSHSSQMLSFKSLHFFNLLIFPFIADVVIQIAALYVQQSFRSSGCISPASSHLRCIIIRVQNNKIMTLTLFPFIADVVIQIIALYASNPFTHPP